MPPKAKKLFGMKVKVDTKLKGNEFRIEAKEKRAKKTSMPLTEKWFYRGFAVCAAFVCEQGGSVNLEDMFRSNGITLEHLREAGCAEFDMDRILKEINVKKIMRRSYERRD